MSERLVPKVRDVGYKYINKEKTGGVHKYNEDGTMGYIPEGSYLWDEYLEWAKTNPTESCMDKTQAYKSVLEKIDQENRRVNQETFPYTKEGTVHNYDADHESIQATQNVILGALVAGLAKDGDPCPAPNGVWKTADTLEDGTPVYIPYTNKEFLVFAHAFFTRASNNFLVKEMHKKALRDLRNNPDKAEDSILNYDYSVGWSQ